MWLHDFTYKWLRDYISDRRQYVCIKGCDSNKARLQYGASKGSILGP